MSTRKPAAKAAPPTRSAWRRLIGRVAIVAGVLTLSGGIGLAVAVAAMTLPDVGGLQAYQSPQSTVLLDAKGRRIGAVGQENRMTVPLDQMSPMLPQAVVAMEDARFYQHFGVDPIGLMRAFVSTIFYGHREGGSTLTQQLAKNLYLTPEQTAKRKIADMLLAIQIERRYTKQQILELYLNQVYWGHGAFGCDAAAMTYFGKHAKTLTLGESALLAGILQGPEYFTPYRVPKVAKDRQKLVLDRMIGKGFITKQEYDGALAAPLRYRGLRSLDQAPYFTSYVRSLLIKQFGAGTLAGGGLKVTTSLDLDWQGQAEAIVARQIRSLRRYRVSQAALVSIDPYTGAIKAMVGGVDFRQSEFNRVVQAHRQPGSSFKPFVYLTALANGKTPDTVMVDEKISFPGTDGRPWTPQNYDRRYHGPMTLRRALEQSINVIAAKLAAEYGPERIIQTARQMGITSPLQANLSLAMGSSEVTPLELASAYGVLATGGKLTPPIAILKVEDAQGNVVATFQPDLREVYHPEPIATLVDMMQGVLTRGSGTAAYFGKPAAGKTGTSSDSRDAWFAGFTPDLVTVVWAGNDDNSPMRGLTGGAVCAPIWGQFMRYATRSLPSRGFPGPGPAVASDAGASDEVGGGELPIPPEETPPPDEGQPQPEPSLETLPEEPAEPGDPGGALPSDEPPPEGVGAV